MKKLTQTEMSSTVAAGCGWIKKLAKEASGEQRQALIDDWFQCKGK